ncbi:hypothetical protein SSX86_025555 [Deinandra increscens subsp. villosa]|uniref:Dof-type domain-containing protein n=1 Tax=Deinandra increscens subsp. villosa TaxID=3103831 RepID=A0AAP0GN42_9ASTR
MFFSGNLIFRRTHFPFLWTQKESSVPTNHGHNKFVAHRASPPLTWHPTSPNPPISSYLHSYLDFYTQFQSNTLFVSQSSQNRHLPPHDMTTDPGIILFGQKIGFNLSPSAATAATENTEDPKTPSIYEEGMPENSPGNSPDGDSTNLPTRTPAKPDKILPCPRCESMNTKFCYFNNSNVSQPRHFCKSCQRYWTAGGTMRSMPVGAGRRKKKNHPPVNCRYIISSQEDFESETGPAGNHIDFASDSNGIPPQFVAGDDCSSGDNNNNNNDNNGFHPGFNWIPIPIPVYPQIPMYPSPYWSSVSWLPHTNSVLGKHPANEESEESVKSNDFKKQRSTVLTPKTLRIHDPDEAAKSSIWVTLGIKNEHTGRGDLFKAFQSKGNEKRKDKAAEPSPVLQANPAAFSRSLWFQERA